MLPKVCHPEPQAKDRSVLGQSQYDPSVASLPQDDRISLESTLPTTTQMMLLGSPSEEADHLPCTDVHVHTPEAGIRGGTRHEAYVTGTGA